MAWRIESGVLRYKRNRKRSPTWILAEDTRRFSTAWNTAPKPQEGSSPSPAFSVDKP